MSIYEIIAEKIISLLERGTVPWRQTWQVGLPRNLITKKEYRGINVFLLWIAMEQYSSPLFLTFRQAKSLGGKVKAGEHGWPVVFWKQVEKKRQENEEDIIDSREISTEKRFILRYYYVFNINQCEGLEGLSIENNKPFCEEEREEVETILKNYLESGPEVKNGLRPRYLPAYDVVQIPPKETFETLDAYYNVLFHELIHSTGHVSRLNRLGLANPRFGTEQYSKEELIAEMGAAILCAHTGIEADIENSAAYINGWLDVLKNDKKMVLVGARDAQKAVDFILPSPSEKLQTE